MSTRVRKKEILSDDSKKRKIFWKKILQKIFHTGKFCMENFPPHITGVISVLATGHKGCGFEPGQGDGFLRAIKSAAHLPLGWEVNREGPM
jgi:hypothetical protein